MLKICGVLLVLALVARVDFVNGESTCSYTSLCDRPCYSMAFWCRDNVVRVPCRKVEPCTTTWVEWGDCSRTCGSGERYRWGMCRGENCKWPKSETEVCNTQACASGVDGEWTDWSAWTSSSCSTTCCGGRYSKIRSRTCTNPAPEGAGRDCAGDAEQSYNGMQCSMDSCSMNCTTQSIGFCFPDDCGVCSSRFFACAGGETPMELSCPTGLFWNNDLSSCMPMDTCTDL